MDDVTALFVPFLVAILGAVAIGCMLVWSDKKRSKRAKSLRESPADLDAYIGRINRATTDAELDRLEQNKE
jgi:hypothetical protein